MSGINQLQSFELKFGEKKKLKYSITFCELQTLFDDYSVAVEIFLDKKLNPVAKSLGVSEWWNGLFDVSEVDVHGVDEKKKITIQPQKLIDPLQMFDLTDLLQDLFKTNLQKSTNKFIENSISTPGTYFENDLKKIFSASSNQRHHSEYFISTL